ncbi:uncharacterized protein L201_006402 [Kwoniella dendrophila CBS 6074]|uniref:Uncharacterized protein n=1 Tax=Kwoniella dendrophila CBS 6074 TaxID=1295534 RepID=A0AAX4K159_9TREE
MGNDQSTTAATSRPKPKKQKRIKSKDFKILALYKPPEYREYQDNVPWRRGQELHSERLRRQLDEIDSMRLGQFRVRRRQVEEREGEILPPYSK